jgi:hypothetical protein
MSDDQNLTPAATARAQLRRLGIAVDNLTDKQATALWADFLRRQILRRPFRPAHRQSTRAHGRPPP